MFDDHQADAEALHRGVAAQGVRGRARPALLREGPDGVIYAARRHGRAHRVKYLELEIRQDLIDSSGRAAEVTDRLATALDILRP